MSSDIKIKRLLHKDILIKHRNTNDFNSSPIYMFDDENKSDIMFFEVVKVSPNVTLVKEGDVVLLPWSRVIPPFMVGDERLTITSEDEIYAVIEY